jgi:hypothetical protein
MKRRFEDLRMIDLDSPRYGRARKFSDTILAVMRDFLPQDEECQRHIGDFLLRLAYEQNASIIEVPPEWDALTKLEIERAMLETKIAGVTIPAKDSSA